MLKHGEVNPLNVFGLRELDHCPPHFERVSFDLFTTEKYIRDWIYENLEGRFWFGTDTVDFNNLIRLDPVKKTVAFEIHSEATYFSLMLDQFNSLNFSQ